MAKTFDRQVAEMHIRIAAMNRFTALGTPVMPAFKLQADFTFSAHM